MQDITHYRVVNAVAVQNYGRSGSTFLQSLLDGHPNILSTPNFYSRPFYEIWDKKIADLPDEEKQKAFIDAFPAWFDTGHVDQAAGLHRLGPDQNQIPHVDRERFAELLATFFELNEMSRRNLFVGAHLAYGLCLDRELASELWVLFPIHGRPKPVAQAFLEDFPGAKFIYTVREPISNFSSSIAHIRSSHADYKFHPIEFTLRIQFCRDPGVGKELFVDRPYFEHLSATDQVKGIRLEDLHARPKDVMAATIGWLGLTWHNCLLESTFDGKKWWNRPESPKQSGFGGQMLRRNVSHHLSALDRFRVTTIAYPKAVAWNYRKAAWTRPSTIWRAMLFKATIWVPWREEWRTGASPYRIVDLTTQARRLMPKSLACRFDEQKKREVLRYSYLELDSGTQKVRANRSDADKPRWVQCMIVLFPNPEDSGYKGKIYEDLPVAEADQRRDHVVVRFADELASREDRPRPPDAFSLAMWTGRMALRVRDYIAIRLWTLRAYRQARREHGGEVALLELSASDSVDSEDGTVSRDSKTDRSSTLSAA